MKKSYIIIATIIIILIFLVIIIWDYKLQIKKEISPIPERDFFFLMFSLS